MSKRAPQPTLSPTEAQEDSQALWDRVRRETRPLKRRKAPLAKAPAKPKQQAKPQDKPQATKGAKGKATKGKAIKPRQVAPAPKPVKPQFPPKPNYGLSRQLDRDLKNHRKPVGAKLDLHAKTLAEAERQLEVFIQAHATDGTRLVLVVTGQGRDADGRPQGAIRRELPKWLERPDNAAWVIAWQEAYPHHGGAGAFYLTLRKQKWRAKSHTP